jgi:invasion protein IalB
MSKLTPSVLLIALAMSFPAFAQDAAAPADTTEAAPAADNGLSMGAPVTDGPAIGETFTRETFGDWQLRCIKSEDGKDPCQLYQLLRDSTDNAVAEINLFLLPEGAQAFAGATVVTPLETLLTEQIRLTVDGGAARRYPFNFCAQVGCISRMGFTDDEITQFKRGAAAQFRIVPASAPNAEVLVNVSLKGFTAGFEALQAE